MMKMAMKRLQTEPSIRWNNVVYIPVATYESANPNDGIFHIIIKDHCYIVMKHDGTGYTPCHYISNDMLRALKKQPLISY